MKVANELKIQEILKKNSGYISTAEAIENGIEKTALYRYIDKYSLIKMAKGLYFQKDCLIDEFFLLQYKYPKLIFSGMSALFLLGLTDKIPEMLEVTAPYNYHPYKKVPENCLIHFETNLEALDFGNIKVKTSLGNDVVVFGKDKMIVELIKKRKEYDSETFLKALKKYVKGKDRRSSDLYQYARMKKNEDQVYDLMEVLLNE